MPSIRSTLTYASGFMGSLLIVGSIMVSQHCGAAATDEHKSAAPASAPVSPPSTSVSAPKSAPAPIAVKPPVTSRKTVAIGNGPSWQALTTAQQLALVPLAGEWDNMDAQRKEKWIAIGNKYARMSTAEQNRIQTRMRDWIKLTPAQRRSVRQSYASTKKWDADQKSAQWQRYLQLSDEQKAQLARQRLSQVPVTAISRAKPKPKPLLPIAPKPARAVAGNPATNTAAAIAATAAKPAPSAKPPATPSGATASAVPPSAIAPPAVNNAAATPNQPNNK